MFNYFKGIDKITDKDLYMNKSYVVAIWLDYYRKHINHFKCYQVVCLCLNVRFDRYIQQLLIRSSYTYVLWLVSRVWLITSLVTTFG
jgi:hypothetical protein